MEGDEGDLVVEVVAVVEVVEDEGVALMLANAIKDKVFASKRRNWLKSAKDTAAPYNTI